MENNFNSRSTLKTNRGCILEQQSSSETGRHALCANWSDCVCCALALGPTEPRGRLNREDTDEASDGQHRLFTAV